jgi:hypothetical protein
MATPAPTQATCTAPFTLRPGAGTKRTEHTNVRWSHFIQWKGATADGLGEQASKTWNDALDRSMNPLMRRRVEQDVRGGV